MSFSHTLAVIILFLALGTWFFDKELKRKEARCISICDSLRGAGSDADIETNGGEYTPPTAGRGRRGHGQLGKCECDTGGE